MHHSLSRIAPIHHHNNSSSNRVGDTFPMELVVVDQENFFAAAKAEEAEAANRNKEIQTWDVVRPLLLPAWGTTAQDQT